MGVKRGEKERGEKGEAGERSFEVAADSFTFRNEIVVLPSLLIRLLPFLLPLHVLPRISKDPEYNYVEIMAVVVLLYRIDVLV